MTENDVNPPINNDPMEKRNEFIDHPSYKDAEIATFVLLRLIFIQQSQHYIFSLSETQSPKFTQRVEMFRYQF